MRKTINKSAVIRRLLKTWKNIYQIQEAMEAELHQVIGRAALYQILAMLGGELDTRGRGRDREYRVKK